MDDMDHGDSYEKKPDHKVISDQDEKKDEEIPNEIDPKKLQR